MDFMSAMQLMEQGKAVRRPIWMGYLFLDIDHNIRHAGKKSLSELTWTLDVDQLDWEEAHMASNNKSKEVQEKEINESRMESLLEQNSSHIKRLYYLEEMILDHHKSVKRLVDSSSEQMQDTIKSLNVVTVFVTSIREFMKMLTEEMKEIKSIYKKNTDIIKQNEEILMKVSLIEDIVVSNAKLKASKEDGSDNNSDDEKDQSTKGLVEKTVKKQRKNAKKTK